MIVVFHILAFILEQGHIATSIWHRTRTAMTVFEGTGGDTLNRDAGITDVPMLSTGYINGQ